jgi:hypothetical protein
MAASRAATARQRQLRSFNQRRREATISATLLPVKGSPPAADATELAVRPSVCGVIHDQGSAVVTFDRETVESLLRRRGWF